MLTVKSCIPVLVVIIPVLLLLGTETNANELNPSELKTLSIEELMNLEVTLVSGAPQKLTYAASDIKVITNEDIRNSGDTNLPEALRLVPNLQVAQMRSNAWIVGARGFNTLFVNKLLVMIDGRTVYALLFAGVFWHTQYVLLEDADRTKTYYNA